MLNYRLSDNALTLSWRFCTIVEAVRIESGCACPASALPREARSALPGCAIRPDGKSIYIVWKEAGLVRWHPGKRYKKNDWETQSLVVEYLGAL